MTSDESLNEKKAKELIEIEFRKYHEALLAADLEEDYDKIEFLNGMSFEHQHIHLHRDELGIPRSVLDAYDFYNESCCDWGGAIIYQAQIDLDLIYVVRVTTDGDDGWVEVFDLEGNLLAAGRTYLELISWGAVEEIRQYVDNFEFPSELDDRYSRTMWK